LNTFHFIKAFSALHILPIFFVLGVHFYQN